MSTVLYERTLSGIKTEKKKLKVDCVQYFSKQYLTKEITYKDYPSTIEQQTQLVFWKNLQSFVPNPPK